jgi:hypothetical protein
MLLTYRDTNNYRMPVSGTLKFYLDHVLLITVLCCNNLQFLFLVCFPNLSKSVRYGFGASRLIRISDPFLFASC